MKIESCVLTPTSMSGQVIFRLRLPGDTKHVDSVSLQMPTEIAAWLKQLALGVNAQALPEELQARIAAFMADEVQDGQEYTRRLVNLLREQGYAIVKAH